MTTCPACGNENNRRVQRTRTFFFTLNPLGSRTAFTHRFEPRKEGKPGTKYDTIYAFPAARSWIKPTLRKP